MMSDDALRQAWLYAYRAAMKTHGRHDQAEDAAQEAALRHAQGRGGPVPTNGWWGVVAHNYVLSQGRKHGVRARRNRDLVGSQTCDPEHLDRERDEASSTFVARALDLLPGRQRVLVQAIWIDGKSYEEASAMLNVPMGTVMSRIWRARQVLKALLRRERCG